MLSEPLDQDKQGGLHLPVTLGLRRRHQPRMEVVVKRALAEVPRCDHSFTYRGRANMIRKLVGAIEP